MMESIFEEPSALNRHRAAPLLKEREQFLAHLLRQGDNRCWVRSVAAYLLQLVRLMELTSLRKVDLNEINRAGERWANSREPYRRKKAGTGSAYCLAYIAKKWFRFHGQLIAPPPRTYPFEDLIRDFTETMRSTQRLSQQTIQAYSSRAALFLRWVATRHDTISSVCIGDVDDFLASKAMQGWRPMTLAGHGQALRAFFAHAATRGWCKAGIAGGVRTPALPKYDGLPKGPSWKEVRRLLQSASGTKPATLRARAIMSLCAIYALRSSEVARLRLDDFDWRDETFAVQHSKRGGLQQYPVQYEVGEAIIRYLTKARPRCAGRHVFLTLHRPYRSLGPASLWQVTSSRMKQLGIDSPHKGPHALRHACATRLLRRGASLQEIADFLGHRSSKSIGLYAKCDTRSLRRVAAFRLGALR